MLLSFRKAAWQEILLVVLEGRNMPVPTEFGSESPRLFGCGFGPRRVPLESTINSSSILGLPACGVRVVQKVSLLVGTVTGVLSGTAIVNQ